MSEFAVDLERVEAMAVSVFGGQYTGARSDRPSLRNWNPTAGSADTDTLGDLPTL